MPGVLHPPRPAYARLMRPTGQFVHSDSYRPPFQGSGLGMNRPRRGGIGTITFPDLVDIADGDRITVDDGNNLVTYELDTLGNGCTFPGAVCVDISGDALAPQIAATFALALYANNTAVRPLSSVGGVFKFQTVALRNNGGLATTGANIEVLGFLFASLGADVIPVRWGLSRGVFGGSGLTS